MKVEISNGELLDKLTILEIKLKKILDVSKRKNIQKEFFLLSELSQGISAQCDQLLAELAEVNNRLWDVEDHLRDCERNGDFGTKFVELARSVYFLNDKRAEIKRRINVVTESSLIEEKSYSNYQAT